MSNRFVQLTEINLNVERTWLNDLVRNTQPAGFREVEFNEDDLERPTGSDGDNDEPAPAEASPATVDTSNPPSNMLSPIAIFENDIREFYPRRGSIAGVPRVGTRIVYRSGAARPVKETYEEVKAMFAALYAERTPASASRSRSRRPGAMTEAEAAVSA